MSKVEYAKKLLNYFQLNGISFHSNLKDNDYKEVEKEGKYLKFFKYKYTEIELSEDLAKQIINFDKVREYKDMLDSFHARKTRTEDGILIFTYKVTPDLAAAATADIMRNTCGIILNVYKQKQDTPEFDKNVEEVVNILDNSIQKEPVGDYGVVFGYSIYKTPTLSQENKEKLIEFQYKTLGPKEQNTNRTAGK